MQEPSPEEAQTQPPKRGRKPQEPTPKETPTTIARFLAVTGEPLPKVLRNDYKEFLNCCRFVEMVEQNPNSPSLYNLWKSFVKSPSFFHTGPTPVLVKPKGAQKQIEKEESTIIESNDSTMEEEVSVIKSQEEDSVVVAETDQSVDASVFVTRCPVASSKDVMQGTVINSLCSCICSESDFLSLNACVLANHPLFK